MCRSRSAFGLCWLILLLGALSVYAERHLKPEGRFGHRQSPREGRGEEAEEANLPLVNSRYTPHQGRDQIEGDPSVYHPQQGQQQEEREGRTRYNYQQKHEAGSSSAADIANDAPSSYSSVVLHNDPQPQRTSTNPQYQRVRGKSTKHQKTYRQNVRGNGSNYKPYKNIKQADPPPLPPPQQSSGNPSPGDSFVHAVHPSIMQNLMKQQPQTFDVPQQKDSEDVEQVASDWQTTEETQKENSDVKSFKPEYNPQNGPSRSQENYDGGKRPIYVPNRVSVQNPSSDSSFNVGYSIGFGNGIVQGPKIGIVQPPIGLRQGKELDYPPSYHNTPINVHVDGKKSVWKNMGAGVEMSHNLDSDFKTYVPQNAGAHSDNNEYSSGTVVNQPIYYNEGFDNSFVSVPTSGRNSFDHNHALQQSNSFDFSNAINPSTSQPYSLEQKSTHFFKQPQLSYIESFAKQPLPSYIESFPKPTHSSYSESLTKQSRPSYVEPQDKQEPSHPVQPQHNQGTGAASGERHKYDGYKFEGIRHERPSFPSYYSGPLRNPNSISSSPKAKAIDFPKSALANSKPSFPFKSFANDFNHGSEELYGHNNFGFSGLHVLPQMYSSPGKSSSGMVQAFLVPVNTPAPSFSYPVGMPIMGTGYSPYFGHPIGMLRIPEQIEASASLKNGYEHSDPDSDLESDPHQYQSSYQKLPSTKSIHTYQSAVKHHQDHQAESSPYQFQREPQLHSRDEGMNTHHHTKKFKRVLTTEAPDPIPSAGKTHSTHSLYNPEFIEPSTSSLHTSHSHPPRLYRRIIVKRT